MENEHRSGVWSGCRLSDADLDRLRAVIADHPTASRAELSNHACVALKWHRADGALRSMRMRVVMLRMHEAGIITLPMARGFQPQPKPELWGKDAFQNPGSPITDRVDLLKGLAIHSITSGDKKNRRDSRIWNASIAAYHYLGYQRPVGHQIRYTITADCGPLACIGFASAAWKIAPRDLRIGWTHDQRMRGLCHIINNTRFLILPWVRSPNLASWILAACAQRLRQDWKIATDSEPFLLETFVDAAKYSGHCYRAANWTNLGTTQGRGRYDRHTERSVSQKHIWVMPLTRDPWTQLRSI
jgi:hypothetical protein